MLTSISVLAQMPEQQDAALSYDKFAIDLYSNLAKQPGNIAVSPFIIYDDLSMLYGGARGETATELAQILHLSDGSLHLPSYFPPLVNDVKSANALGFQLDLGNSFWGLQGYPFKKSFLDFLVNQHESDLKMMDLTNGLNQFDPVKAGLATDQINAWVKEKTQGAIPLFLPAGFIKEDTRFLIVSAVHLKGYWNVPFSEELTRPENFFIHSNEPVAVPTMHADGDYGYAKNASLEMVELPYVSGQYAMIILLPQNGVDISQVEKELSYDGIAELRKNVCRTNVYLSLPKFKEASTFDLVKPLRFMGLERVFSESADLGGISISKPLFIQGVRHYADIQVDELGTKASAAAAIFGIAGYDRVNFTANHPFLFLIQHNQTGAILFMGRVENPLAQ